MTEDQPQPELKQPELKQPDRMGEEAIQEMVRAALGNQLVTATSIPPELLGSVFMPVGLGVLAGYDWDHIGNIVEFMSKASPRLINGYPSFFSCKVVHIEDWTEIVRRVIELDKVLKAQS